MRKALIVAAAELGQSVRTKAFIVSVLLMPILLGGSVVVQRFVERHSDESERRFAVLDHTGKLASGLVMNTAARNLLVAGRAAAYLAEVIPVPLPGAPAAALDELRLTLSERIRDKTLFAFIEIPAATLDGDGAVSQLRYHSDSPTYEDLRAWLELSLNEQVRLARFERLGLDAAVAAHVQRPVPSAHLGLLARSDDGVVREAKRVDQVRTLGVPIIAMMLVFMVVMMSAPQLLNSVLEEKMSRISEVLLGAVTPFELMLGKLTGSACVSLLLATIYAGGGYAAATILGRSDAFPLELIPWLVIFLVVAVFLFGSIFLAVGAACSDIRDAQSLMTPVMMIAIFPMFVWIGVFKNPESTFAVTMSMIPTATPFLMMLRLSLHPGPPLWQVLLSLVLCGGFTYLCVRGAGKIFRVGLLLQGKAPSLRELWRWARAD
ncbi:MAG: ABC transporter permease [Myxococcales bacterium]|nr:ABC transporter permease [Myxococcales bacterium]